MSDARRFCDSLIDELARAIHELLSLVSERSVMKVWQSSSPRLMAQRHHMFDEQVGQRLGQCRDGELLYVAEKSGSLRLPILRRPCALTGQLSRSTFFWRLCGLP
ncbi:hypothetical protein RFN29_31760 [Mesorhizobium sp. VK22B]|uniref:Uncharacterized protein n=1 Tax=Mesorhizobium captivum TaxID=3072319 RepID=A0ABU4ZA38_9HYPH|nr:hypothetical protein [Mesorhizobium sp. VK22B]MDX8496106.1 hypothetical protein [Mesorhizobium sp. VK22B]